jgi:transposase
MGAVISSSFLRSSTFPPLIVSHLRILYLEAYIRHTNEDAAHKVASQIAAICAKYPGSILLFERLRKIKPKGRSKSRRMNRRQANQLRGKIRQYAGEKAYARNSVVTVEINPHGTSQYCSRCGAKGKRFFIQYKGAREQANETLLHLLS